MAGAALGAAGSIAGGVISGKGAKKAAKIQQKTAEEQMAQTKQFYDDAVTRYQPDIDQANRASNLYAGLLGDGGNAQASQDALNTWKNSVSYNTVLNNALNDVNANAYAGGMGRSGAAMKALQDRGTDIANSYLQTYLGNLNTQVQTGANAKSALTGAGTTALGQNNQSLGNAGNAASNAALSTANTWSNVLQNLGNTASNAYQSSYGSTGGPGAYQYGGQDWNSWLSSTPSWMLAG